MSTPSRTTLHESLARAFSLSELNVLCHSLGFDAEDLDNPAGSRPARAAHIIAYIERRDLWPTFLAHCQRERPAVEWLALIEAHQRSRAPQPLMAAPSRQNPFFANGRINNPAQFFGRERLLREVRAELSKFASVSLLGESEIGKSSLLYYLFATRANWLPDVLLEYVDLQGVLSQADFCETLLGKLGREGDTPLLLRRAVNAFAADGRKIILLMDEAERLAEADIDPRVLDLLRSFAQEPPVALCLATRRPLVEVFPPRNPGGLSPFHNVFTEKRVPPFTPDEMRTFLRGRLGGAGLVVSESDLEALLAESNGGNPSRLQRAASRWFEAWANSAEG